MTKLRLCEGTEHGFVGDREASRAKSQSYPKKLAIVVFHERFVGSGLKFVLRLLFHKEEIKVRHRGHSDRLHSVC